MKSSSTILSRTLLALAAIVTAIWAGDVTAQTEKTDDALTAKDVLGQNGVWDASDLAELISPIPQAGGAPPNRFSATAVDGNRVTVNSDQPNGWHLEIGISSNHRFLLLQFPTQEIPSTDREYWLNQLLQENSRLGLMRFEVYKNSSMAWLTYPILNENVTHELLEKRIRELFAQAEASSHVWSFSDTTKSDSGADAEPMPTEIGEQADAASAVAQVRSKLSGTAIVMAIVNSPTGSFGMMSFSPIGDAEFAMEVQTSNGTMKDKGTYKIENNAVVLFPVGADGAPVEFAFESVDTENGVTFAHASGNTITFSIN